MSQMGAFLKGTGAQPLETLSGNTGGNVSPDAGGDIEILGSGVVQVTGDPVLHTLTISVNGEVSTVYETDSGSATSDLGVLNIVGGSGITTSGADNTITITATGGGSGITQLDGDVGSASGVTVDLLGGNNITTTGDNADSMTISVSGTSNHSIQVGNGSGSLTSLGVGTAGQVMTSNGAGSNPAFDDIGVDSGLTAHSVVLAQGNSAFTALGAATNGQVIIGSTGANPVLATLTEGANITITNGAGSITIAASGGGMSWTEVTGTSQSMAVNNGYILNNAGLVTATLPATAAVGDIVAVVGKGAGGWAIAQNAGDIIHFGNVNTTTGVGGSLASTNRYDSIELICIVANDEWVVRSSIGNITFV